MAIHRASDSLSRCDPSLYSNIYDVRKRPDIKHEPIHATQPTHKDTLEISRDKLKEEALNRLRHTSKYVIAQNSFMRIGKYLFLAITFPPYLLIYGLPKWILIEGLPTIFSTFVWMWKKVQQKTQKRLDTGVRKVAQMIQFMQNIAQRVLIQPIIRLALEIRQGIQRMRERTLQFFKRVKERVNIALRFPGLKMTEGIKHLQKKLSQVREKMTQHAQTMATKIQEGIQWVKQSPQILLGWGQAQIQYVNQRAVAWRIQWAKRLEGSQQLADRATNWVSKQFKQGLESFKRDFEPLVNFYRQQILPHWHKLKGVWKGKWQQARDFSHRKHQRALAFLQRKQEKLKHLSHQHLIDSLLSHVWMGKLPLYLQQWLKKWLSHPIVNKLCAKGMRVYSWLALGFLQGLSQCLQALAYGMTMMFKTCEFIQVYVKIARQKVLEALQLTLRVSRKLALYTLYYCLLSIMMVAILFIWSMRYLGGLMSYFTQGFPFSKPSHK